jgi:single-strand DNA-binding protein
MAKSVNKVILLGNVGKDPDVHVTPTGTVVSTFSLATSDRIKDQSGNWRDQSEWHNLVAFKRTAEIVRDYVKKGSKVYVEGKLQTRSWNDEETKQKKYRTEVVVLDLGLLSSANGSHRQGDTTEPEPSAEYGELGITDADLPF